MKIKSRLFLELIIGSMMILIFSSCEKELIDTSTKNSNTFLINRWSLEAWIDYNDSLAFIDNHKKQYHITGWTTYNTDCLNYIIEANLYLSSTSCEDNNYHSKFETNQNSVLHIQRIQKRENNHAIYTDCFEFKIDNICLNNDDAKTEILQSLIDYIDKTYLN